MTGMILSTVGSGMTETLIRFRNEVLFGSGKLGAVTDVGISLAAFCACAAMVYLIRQYLKTDKFSWSEFGRPVLLFILVCSFPTIVVRPLDFIQGVYNGRLSSAVGGSMTEFQQMFRDVSESVAQETDRMFGERMEQVEMSDKSWLQKKCETVALTLKKWVAKQTNAVTTSLASVALGLVFILFKLMCSVMIIMATVNQVVLTLLGPFCFALSILPAYRNGIKLWVERYIQYSLWIPLTHICCYLCTSLAKIDLSMTLGAGNGVNNIGYCFTSVLLLLISFKLITQIPGLASFIIESGSAETISRDMLAGMNPGRLIPFK